jgi:hypothetical protein
VARLRISIVPSASGVRLEIDGRRRPIGDAPILLDPGNHELRAEGQGASAERELTLAAGQELAITLTLESRPLPGAAIVEDEGAPSPLLWTGLAITGVGLVVGSVTGGLSLATLSDVDERCDADRLCPEEARDDVDRARLLAHISTAGFATAGAGAVMALVGLLLPTDDAPDETEARTRPLLGPGFLGIDTRF